MAHLTRDREPALLELLGGVEDALQEGRHARENVHLGDQRLVLPDHLAAQALDLLLVSLGDRDQLLVDRKAVERGALGEIEQPLGVVAHVGERARRDHVEGVELAFGLVGDRLGVALGGLVDQPHELLGDLERPVGGQRIEGERDHASSRPSAAAPSSPRTI